MNRKTLLVIFVFGAASLGSMAQNITPQMLEKFKTENTMTATDRAIHNAMAANDVRNLAVNQANQTEMDTYFTYSVPSKGITDQLSSGRCWLFTGLNVMRSKVINEHKLPGLTFSHVYNFFYDQLEKSNLFLQAIIDTGDKPMEDKTVEWLFKNPLSDGGTFTGVADLVAKYGIVPSGVMPETYASNNTARFIVTPTTRHLPLSGRENKRLILRSLYASVAANPSSLCNRVSTGADSPRFFLLRNSNITSPPFREWLHDRSRF